ncbi:helix-hairpin-helix domain-containing protein [Metabacillus herbersteinensis]|uniref:Helix-hairpin-helix domain-containing protein n=1 Tax=Metabacillus herbersteinensis TaxID=283816 RepID=A0ABV6GD25_9BACI
MKVSSPKIPLTPEEKLNLKKCKIKLHEIADMDIMNLSQCLQSSFERANYLRGLAQFQTVPSIGPKVAKRLVDLGYYSLQEVKTEEGADLINRLEERIGYWEDPCLEDSFRCIVHHANHPESNKSWFDFTPDRKSYREQYGYPTTRPTIAWYEKKKNTNN